jgi:hypothetical protein
MRPQVVLVVLLGSVLAVPVASACSPVDPIPSPSDLVNSAEVIVWARARGRSAEPGERGGPAGDRSKVEFAVAAVLKGRVGSPTITLNGHLEERSDPNDHDAPYRFVRPGGRRGNCYALAYQRGAEYLLFLKRTEGGDLAPYWSPLAPTNEQVLGPDDVWIQWVIAQLRR